MEEIRNFVAQSIPSEDCSRNDVKDRLISILNFSDLDDPKKKSYIDKIENHFQYSCDIAEHALYKSLQNDVLTPKTAEYAILKFAHCIFGDTITCRFGKAYRRYFENKQFDDMIYDMSCGKSIIEYFSDIIDAIENVSHTSQDSLREQIDRASKDIEIFFKLVKLDTDDNIYYEATRLWFYAEKRKFAMVEVIANICVDKYKALRSFMVEFQGLLFSNAKEEISNLILHASKDAKSSYGTFMMAVVSTADGILNCIIENSYNVAINGIALTTMGAIGKMFECLDKISNTNNRCAYAMLLIYAFAGELCMIMHLGREYQFPTRLEHYVEGLYSMLILLGREPAVDPCEAEDIRDGVLRATAVLLKYIHCLCLDASSFDQVLKKVAEIYRHVVTHPRLSLPNPKNVVGSKHKSLS